MAQFEIAEGSPGLAVAEVAHVFIPGRGRDGAGENLNPKSQARAEHAADFYIDTELEQREGVLVPSGYKSPADTKGTLWSPDDDPSEVFIGIPEAELMRRYLLSRGIGACAIRPEMHSIDTITNFVCSEQKGYFPDERPVAIVAQAAHLDRMLTIIAPRTLRREYLGVVVPETESEDPDSNFARVFSRIALRGIHPTTPDALEKTTKRVARMWRMVNKARSVWRLG